MSVLISWYLKMWILSPHNDIHPYGCSGHAVTSPNVDALATQWHLCWLCHIGHQQKGNIPKVILIENLSLALSQLNIQYLLFWLTLKYMQKDKTSSKSRILGMTLNYTWGWGSSFCTLRRVEYLLTLPRVLVPIKVLLIYLEVICIR